ncbi:hypothetical protein B0T16DRAFT_173731 [Cercophora newfieldiana]|uniref:Heterokaryon incompatibility domain-containing protein n=1 Tax=Cercophora newfieldiana TaxID=92897 RepID=A0AA39XZ25_9PEZI|nr:hypothetical protein B0T16DRAFT_173731 [Cercophora newfieldiana]
MHVHQLQDSRRRRQPMMARRVRHRCRMPRKRGRPPTSFPASPRGRRPRTHLLPGISEPLSAPWIDQQPLSPHYTTMLVSTSALLTITAPSSGKQIEALIEGRCFDVARHTTNRKGRMSGVDIAGLDLAYPSSQQNDFDFLEPFCSICSDFPLWLQHATSEGLEPRFFCLGPLRRVVRGSSSCRLCRLVLQSVTLRCGIFDHDFPSGLAVCLYPRGRAAFDVRLSPGSSSKELSPDPRGYLSQRNLPLRLSSQNKLGNHLQPSVRSANRVGKSTRLFDTKDLRVVTALADTPYCALRYNAQGTVSSAYNQGWVTKSANPDYSARWVHLPVSIKHAIAFTKQLGHRYLWVDWLCDDLCPPDPEVARKQLARLPKLFANAAFVMLAGAGRDNVCTAVVGVYKSPDLPIPGVQFGQWTLTSCLSIAVDPPVREPHRRPYPWSWNGLFSHIHPYRSLPHEQEELSWKRNLDWSYGTLVLCHADGTPPIAPRAARRGKGNPGEHARSLKKAALRMACTSASMVAVGWFPRRFADLVRHERDVEGDVQPLLEK